MTTSVCSAATFFILTGVSALAADNASDANPVAPAKPIKAQVVDTPEMKAKPKPRKPDDDFDLYPYLGESVEVRWAPTKAAPVFAHFAGGADVEVHGQPVKRDGVVWVEVDFLGVRGWVPKDRVSADSERDTWGKRWDIRFISPSGKVVVEFHNRGVGDVSVNKDGTGGRGYSLDLGPVRNWAVSDMVLFSRDESCLTLSYGGASWGTQTFIYARNSKGKFRRLEMNLQDRCWKLAREKGLVPKGADPAHLYMEAEEPTDHGFVILLRGDYTGAGHGQTRFGPLRFIWTRQGDKLESVK